MEIEHPNPVPVSSNIDYENDYSKDNNCPIMILTILQMSRKIRWKAAQLKNQL